MTDANRPVVTHSYADQRDLDALATELKLSTRERLFCEYIASGQARSNADAARLAGYPEDRARQEGWRVGQREDVRAFLRACTLANMQSMTVRATQVLGELLSDASVDAKTRKDIAFGIIDRAGAMGKTAGASTTPVQVNINLGQSSTGPVIEQ